MTLVDLHCLVLAQWPPERLQSSKEFRDSLLLMSLMNQLTRHTGQKDKLLLNIFCTLEQLKGYLKHRLFATRSLVKQDERRKCVCTL